MKKALLLALVAASAAQVNAQKLVSITGLDPEYPESTTEITLGYSADGTLASYKAVETHDYTAYDEGILQSTTTHTLSVDAAAGTATVGYQYSPYEGARNEPADNSYTATLTDGRISTFKLDNGRDRINLTVTYDEAGQLATMSGIEERYDEQGVFASHDANVTFTWTDGNLTKFVYTNGDNTRTYNFTYSEAATKGTNGILTNALNRLDLFSETNFAFLQEAGLLGACSKGFVETYSYVSEYPGEEPYLSDPETYTFTFNDDATVATVYDPNTWLTYTFAYEAEQAGIGVVDGNAISFAAADLGLDNATEVTEITLTDGTVITFDAGGNNNTPKYYNSGEAVRMYPGNNFTITASKPIASVELTVAENKNAPANASGDITAEPGTVSTEDYTVLVSDINSNTVTVTNASTQSGAPSQLRFTNVKITYVDGTTGVAAVTAAKSQAVEIYTLSGARVNSLQPGVNIVKGADGRVRKVMAPAK